MDLDRKYVSLSKALKKLGRVIVAYSGGVDSTFLLKAAVDSRRGQGEASVSKADAD
ncbi:MAG: hypothetical protein ACYS76_08255 [Planctomycetota bacterium]|jgi:uncharacterized protein